MSDKAKEQDLEVVRKRNVGSLMVTALTDKISI